ncbi:MAG: cytochrome o ubiquinol oxidase operon protein cyoD [Candidatus Tokpelaia sp. JSC085]|nr:MAG: cytochrome o ubiquinol oxidase operon protein cyoD [Candidatus Tokpelaia sp. JSC085]
MKATTNHGISVTKYMLGFILSVILTLLAFSAVMMGWIDQWLTGTKIIFLLGLAVIQMLVQIVFFLHLDEGPDAQWNIRSMWLAASCVLIIIAGTWMTMRHLNYNMMGGSGRVIRSDVLYPAILSPQSPQNERPAEIVPET